MLKRPDRKEVLLALVLWALLFLVLVFCIRALAWWVSPAVVEYFTGLPPENMDRLAASRYLLPIFLDTLARPTVSLLVPLSMLVFVVVVWFVATKRRVRVGETIGGFLAVPAVYMSAVALGWIGDWQVTFNTALVVFTVVTMVLFSLRSRRRLGWLTWVLLPLGVAPFADILVRDALWPNYFKNFLARGLEDISFALPHLSMVLAAGVSILVILMPLAAWFFFASTMHDSTFKRRSTALGSAEALLGLVLWLAAVGVIALDLEMGSVVLNRSTVSYSYAGAFLLYLIAVCGWHLGTKLKAWVFAFYAVFPLLYLAIPMSYKSGFWVGISVLAVLSFGFASTSKYTKKARPAMVTLLLLATLGLGLQLLGPDWMNPAWAPLESTVSVLRLGLVRAPFLAVYSLPLTVPIWLAAAWNEEGDADEV